MSQPKTLTKIKFNQLDGEEVENTYGYQETDQFGNLLHLYDENGEQLDTGKYFPDSKFESIGHSSHLEDIDDFWNAIESMRFARD